MKQVFINGWQWLYCPQTRRVFEPLDLTQWTCYSKLTQNERNQISNQLNYIR